MIIKYHRFRHHIIIILSLFCHHRFVVQVKHIDNMIIRWDVDAFAFEYIHNYVQIVKIERFVQTIINWFLKKSRFFILYYVMTCYLYHIICIYHTFSIRILFSAFSFSVFFESSHVACRKSHEFLRFAFIFSIFHVTSHIDLYCRVSSQLLNNDINSRNKFSDASAISRYQKDDWQRRHEMTRNLHEYQSNLSSKSLWYLIDVRSDYYQLQICKIRIRNSIV